MAELEEFRHDIRKFADGVIAPHAADIDKNNIFPDKGVVDLWKEMGNLGLHQITVPEEDGGKATNTCNSNTDRAVYVFFIL